MKTVTYICGYQFKVIDSYSAVFQPVYKTELIDPLWKRCLKKFHIIHTIVALLFNAALIPVGLINNHHLPVCVGSFGVGVMIVFLIGAIRTEYMKYQNHILVYKEEDNAFQMIKQ